MAATAMNPMTLLYPQGVADQASIDQQRMLAQAILSQGMQPMQSNAMAGNVAYHVSPLEGIAKMLQTGMGMKLQDDANQKSLALALRQQQAMGNMFGAGQQQPQGQSAQPVAQPTDADNQQALVSVPANGGPAGPTNKAALLAQAIAQQGQQPAAQPQGQPQQVQSGGFSLPGMTPQQSMALYLMNPDEYTKTLLSYSTPTDATRMAIAAHQDPAKANAAVLQKQSYIEPVMGRPGTIGRDPITGKPLFFNPQIPNGGAPLFDASGNVVGMKTIPGAAQVESDMAEAKTAGEGNALPYAGVDEHGNPLPVINRTQAATGGNVPAPMRNKNPGALMPGGKLAQFSSIEEGIAALDANLQKYGKAGVNTLAGVISKWAPPGDNNTAAYIADVSKRLSIPPNQKIDLSSPLVRHALSTGIMLHENGASAVFGSQGAGQGNGQKIYAQAPMGANQGMVNSQNNMSSDWKDLSSQNSQAQNTVSLLQNIKRYAQKAAVGSLSDKLNYANGLLSMIGVKGATDAKTANDLLAKNANQIAMRLGGSGGMSTDAGRALIQAAYPNADMSLPAINEAADNLIAASQMTQAKAQYLLDPYNGNNPQAYNQRKQVFEQYADPRIWQLANMPAEQRDAWLRKQPDAADLYSKLKVARNNGWAKF